MLRRPNAPKDPVIPPATPEVELIDVTRLEVVLDTGMALSFDLDWQDTQKENDTHLEIHLGPRYIRIALARILFIETRPHKKQVVRAAGTL